MGENNRSLAQQMPGMEFANNWSDVLRFFKKYSPVEGEKFDREGARAAVESYGEQHFLEHFWELLRPYFH